MDFEWDETKRQTNILKHDVDLLEAVVIFDDFTVIEQDSRDYGGETRWKATGMIEGECFVLIYTQRGNAMRLISAWKGGRRARRKYQTRYAGRDPWDAGSR